MKKVYLTLPLLLTGLLATAQTTDRLPLVEGFTSNTCPPCASFNASYSPVLNANAPNEENNPGVAVVKYQMDWPSPGTDPSNNDDADARRSFYQVSGIPDWFIDAGSISGNQAEIDASKNNPAEIEITAAYTITGTTIDVEVELNPLVNLGAGARLFIALTNKEYTYTGGTNGETTFQHVFRKMMPAAGGIFLSPLNAGTPVTKTESYTFTVGTPSQTDYNLWNTDVEVVVWVQKTTNKEVFNAAIAQEGALGIEEGDSDEFGMYVYPNPSNDLANVAFDGVAGETSTVEVYDNVGQLVLTETVVLSGGRQIVSLSTNELSTGLYSVVVRNGNKRATSKLMVTK